MSIAADSRARLISTLALVACTPEIVWLSQDSEGEYAQGNTGAVLLPTGTTGSTAAGSTSSISETSHSSATTDWTSDLTSHGSSTSAAETTGITETEDEDVDEGDVDERRPIRDEWREVLETSFEDDGKAIAALRIGGRSHLGNFANRGNIEVLHDTDGKIIVEMRRFTFARNQTEAEAEFAKIQPWAYTGLDLDPEPGGPSGATICNSEAWHDGCQLRVWYTGGDQPEDTGADLRVHLPTDYRGHLVVITEDNLFEEGYPDRGDILIDGLESSLSVELDAGKVDIRRRSGGNSAIDCHQAEIEHCRDVDWFPEQGCECETFAWLELQARGPSEIKLDLGSPSLVAKIDARNDDPSLAPGDDSLCEAKVECANFDDCSLVDDNPRTPWIQLAELNVEDVAFRARPLLKMSSALCQKLMVADDPEDFWLAKYEIHGNLTVCNNDGRGC